MTGTVDEMTCQDLVELVTDYLEGALPPIERERFEMHLDMCDGCTAYVDQMRQTLRLLGRLTVDDIPAEEQENLLELFRGWRRG
jgi:predicted anti-sigma-YlaC factor YlaD